MIQSDKLRVSIVIPVYNEGRHLEACLRAVAAQSVRPHEVIVVDNNSTDESRYVANRFDFVTLISEPKQGVLHARARGFDAATGDIIARIDADTLLPPDWTASVRRIFSGYPGAAAVSGSARYYDAAGSRLFNVIDLFFRRRLDRRLGDRTFLWGANMAIRREAWRAVRPYLCSEGDMHEDYDIAIHLQEMGRRVAFDERLKASVSSRRVDVGYLDFMRYVLVSPRTYARHDIRAWRHMYGVIAICAVGYLPARLLYRGYDPAQGHFSFARLMAPPPTARRVDPTTNVV